MSDLIERLRRYSYQQGTGDEQGQLIHELVSDMHEAADEIERLRELQKRDIAAARIRILEAEIEQLTAQVESLQNKCANRGLSPEDSDALQAEIERLQQGIVSLRVAHKEATDRCAELEAEIERLRAENEMLWDQLKDAERRETEAERQIERLKKELALRTPKGLQHD